MRPILGTPIVDYSGEDLEALSTMYRYRESIVRHFQPYLMGDAVEIGAGIGNIADHIEPLVDSLLLVEPSMPLVEKLHKKFSCRKKMDIMHQDFNGFLRCTRDKSFDCVVLVNLLEHIEDDALALKGCHRVLRAGGYVLILVPALPMLYSKLDEKHGHYRRYTKAGLLSRVEKSGLDVIYRKYFDLVGVFPWLLLNTLLGATTFNRPLMSVYDKICVPITRALETVFDPPFGKNLIVICRRVE